MKIWALELVEKDYIDYVSVLYGTVFGSVITWLILIM